MYKRTTNYQKSVAKSYTNRAQIKQRQNQDTGSAPIRVIPRLRRVAKLGRFNKGLINERFNHRGDTAFKKSGN